MVQLYSPGGTNLHPDLLHGSLNAPDSASNWHVSRFSHFCISHGRQSLYFYNGRPSTLKIAPLKGGSGPHQYDNLGIPESITQTASQSVQLLWSPYVIGQTIIFSCCFFLSSFFSSPNLSGRRLDVYHTLAHGVALVQI